MRTTCHLVVAALGIAFTSTVSAWADPRPAPSITIPLIERAPLLEDYLAAFTDAGFASPLLKVQDLRQRTPSDGAPVSERTDVYLGYDVRALYVVFVCFDRESHLIRSRLVGRDKIPDDDDNVAINIDAFHDRKHAYGFEVNAAGVQLDGLFSESAGWDFSFDMVWSSDARITPHGYIVRMAIPFDALRFVPDNPDGWGLLLYRGIPRKNEDAYWPQYSPTIAGRLIQAGNLHGLEGVSPGGRMQFVPYTSFAAGRSLDLRDSSRPHFASDTQTQVGLDSKFVVHNSVVVDATVNPDFSQVESDQPQETLNQRFEVFFPELRPFFLENASYFSTPLNLVFTRRIADPQIGGRATGKAGRYAFGALVSDDRSPGELRQPSAADQPNRALFSAVRVSRDVGANDSVGTILTSRTDGRMSNYVGGIDGRLTIAHDWVASAQAATSVTDDGSRRVGQAYEASVVRAGRRLNDAVQYHDRSADFRSDIGFINRVDIRDVSNTLSYRFRPEGKRLIDWGPDLFTESIWDHHGLLLGTTYTPKMTLELVRGTTLTVFHSLATEVLRAADAPALETNRAFNEDQSGITFGTSTFARCVLFGTFSAGRGIDFIPPAGLAPEAAKVQSATTTLSVRLTDGFTLDGSYILTRVRDPIVDAPHFKEQILRTKWTYQFTRAASVRTIVQYHDLLPNARFTSADVTKRLTADMLFTYLVHPYTALYVGYTDDRQNIDPALVTTLQGLARTRTSLLNDGRQLFLKVSYLIRR